MAKVETKVTASTTAAALSGMILWVLGKYVFKGDVPDVFASWIYIVVPGALAYAAGWLAPHTPRPVPPQQQQQPVVLPSSSATGYPLAAPHVEEQPPAP
jgi:drug/metabolite transporter (DMT)-like permease